MTHRALVALDALGHPVILATDSAHIAFDCEAVSTDAEDVGMCRTRDVGPGLWLWAGEIKTMHSPGDTEYSPEYVGTLRAVTNMVEAADLFTMRAPEPEYEEDDRETPDA